MQCSNTVLMVRPANFAYNAQTAENNVFQQEAYGSNAQEIALKEFNEYVELLKGAGVNVIVVDDTLDPHTPDSIFPNNWFTTHTAHEVDFLPDKGTTLVLYPMFAPNRRAERDKNVLKRLGLIKEDGVWKLPKGGAEVELSGKKIGRLIDLTRFEKQNKFLEGTGSMVLDRVNRIAFCCESVRTNEEVLEVWAEELGYDYFLFEAEDENGTPIYHTNVMMCVGVRYAFVCLDAIVNLEQRERLIEILEENGKEIIEISFEQMAKYAGNMLVVRASEEAEKELVLVLSATAKASLDEYQLAKLQEHYKSIVSPNLDCIEKNGGGSARCMLAEVF